MRDADQAVRARPSPSEDELSSVDVPNITQLTDIIAEHGWPGRSLVGDDGARAAWLIAQHASRAPGFQKRCLEHVRAAAATGELPGRLLAYLEDRVGLRETGHQRYGTQGRFEAGYAMGVQPLAEPERVDQLRSEVGLEPLRQYLVHMLASYYGKDELGLPVYTPTCQTSIGEADAPDRFRVRIRSTECHVEFEIAWDPHAMRCSVLTETVVRRGGD